MKRTSAFILAAILSLLPLVSCGGSTVQDRSDTSSSSGDGTSAPVEAPETSGVPAGTDLGGETISIWYTTKSVSAAETFVDLNPELTGDILDDAIFNMNKAVEAKLNCTLDFFNAQVGTSDTGAEVQKMVFAGDETYDLYHIVQWNGAQLAAEGCYTNLGDAKYISYDKPWWDYKYMKEMTIGDDVIYCLSGDFAVDRTRCLNCVYYNKSMYEDFYKDPDGLYQEVLDGNWTWEMMRKISADVYSDLNNDGIIDREDRLGFSVNNYNHIDSFFYATGARVTERDKDDIPVICLNSEHTAEVMQGLYELIFNTEGVFCYGSGYDDDVKNRQHFENGNSMFLPGFFYTAEFMRDMKADYGIVPFPKFNEDQKQYYSDVHNIIRLMVVPVTCQKVDDVCAVLEEMAFIGYNDVLAPYYNVLMKNKYARDDVSAQMLDIIRDNCSPDFAHMTNFNNIGYIQRLLIRAKSSDFASTYATYYPEAQKKLDDFIKVFTENK
ncbi:MAG: hypothetical protein ACI4T6_04910 [Candidatus Flemingiibacterium sp.]